MECKVGILHSKGNKIMEQVAQLWINLQWSWPDCVGLWATWFSEIWKGAPVRGRGVEVDDLFIVFSKSNHSVIL